MEDRVVNSKQKRQIKARRRKRFNVLRAGAVAILLVWVGKHFHQELGLVAEWFLKGAEIAAAAILELLLIAD